MKKYNYKDLDLYKAAKDLVLSVYALLRKFPKEEQYALCDQLRRAVISIPSNIAEGSGRNSQKDQAHFYNIAMALYWRCSLNWMLHATLGILVTRSLNKWNY